MIRRVICLVFELIGVGIEIVQFLVAIAIFCISPAGDTNTIKGSGKPVMRFYKSLVVPAGCSVGDEWDQASAVLWETGDNPGIFGNCGGKIHI